MRTSLFVAIASLAMLATLASCAESSAENTPGYNHVIPDKIMTPDTVETRIGTLEFFDGMPDEATVEKAYENLDFMRGVDVFLNFSRDRIASFQPEIYPVLQIFGAYDNFLADLVGFHVDETAHRCEVGSPQCFAVEACVPRVAPIEQQCLNRRKEAEVIYGHALVISDVADAGLAHVRTKTNR